jgi:NAD+ dependent glucose-6-phosphate dehydrogenase
MTPNTVLVTGAAGNLGAKLRRHLEGRFQLRLIDIASYSDCTILKADLSQRDPRWVNQFAGVDAVVHLAADPTAHQNWSQVIAPNIDGLINVFQAAARAGVKRLIYASSNHVMGGYADAPEQTRLTTDIASRPGTHYEVNGQPRDSTPYAAAKLFGERLGKSFADSSGMSVLAVRIGWVRPGENRPEDIPKERGPWFRLMWLSNRDFCHLMERCLVADLAVPFAVINGMSANTGMRWDISYTRDLIGYNPQDDVTRG